jgi:hypothetical protein
VTAAAERFVFVPFGAHAPERAAACDGTVPGAVIDLSHWEGNHTPPELAADTSTESALAFARSGARIEIAVNNHFDADGALSVFALVRSDVALAHADLLIAAAEAGDFDEWPSDDRGLRLEAAVRRLGSLRTEPRAYERVIAELEGVLHDVDAREDLWGAHWRVLETARATLARGGVEIAIDGKIATIVHHRGISELPGPVISRAVREISASPTRWLLAFERDAGTWDYRYELLRHAWATTVKRPRLATPGRNATATKLSRALDVPFDAWALKNDLGMTGILRTAAPIARAPKDVARAAQ